MQGQSNPLKALVSKKKNRLKEDGFDLDLTYITENIIAMGFPSQEFQSIYRNSLADVFNFLQTKHQSNYKIYNLCAQRSYDKAKFMGRVSHYPFEDHNPPPFHLLFEICQDIHNYLFQNPKNVVAVHCKAGKGRTGVVICCYLLYERVFDNYQKVIQFFAKRRTQNSKGVTIPSQLRYINYFAKAIKNQIGLQQYFKQSRCVLRTVRLITIPDVSFWGGCKPYFKIRNREQKLFDSRKKFQLEKYQLEAVAIFQPLQVFLQKDFHVQFYHSSLFKKRLFGCWLNGHFCRGKIVISRRMLDGLQKQESKEMSESLHLELEFDKLGNE